MHILLSLMIKMSGKICHYSGNKYNSYRDCDKMATAVCKIAMGFVQGRITNLSVGVSRIDRTQSYARK